MSKISPIFIFSIVFFFSNEIKSQSWHNSEKSSHSFIQNNFIANTFADQFYNSENYSGFDTLGYYRRMLNINKNGMFALGGWAAANIISGIYFKRKTTLDALKYFHEANVYWNIVNLGLATYGLLSYAGNYDKNTSFSNLFIKQHNYEKIYLFNAGLDVGYYFLGRYLSEKADNSPSTARLSGYGTSLMLQAAFLIAFDISMYLIHRHQAKSKLYKQL